MTGDWSMAVAVGYDKIEHFNVDTMRARAEGEAIHLGVGLRRSDAGFGDLGLYIAGGWQSVDMQRQVMVFEQQTGQSSPESAYAKVGAEFGRTLQAGRWFARPSLGVSATAQRQMGQMETGLAGLGVEAIDDTQVYGEATPQLGFGITLTDASSTQASLKATVGAVFRTTDRIEAPLRLLGANANADPAMISAAIDQAALRASVDLTVADVQGWSLSLSYGGEFGDTTTTQTAGFRLKARF